MHRLALLLALLLPASASAQSRGPLDPGTRVYVRHEGRRIEGTLVTLGDTLTIATAGGLAALHPSPRVVYRHVGRTSRMKGFLVGAGIGAALGGGIGFLVGHSSADRHPNDVWLSSDYVGLATAMIGGGIGATAGGSLGLSLTGDRWEAVQVRPAVGIGTLGGASAVVVGLRLGP